MILGFGHLSSTVFAQKVDLELFILCPDMQSNRGLFSLF